MRYTKELTPIGWDWCMPEDKKNKLKRQGIMRVIVNNIED